MMLKREIKIVNIRDIEYAIKGLFKNENMVYVELKYLRDKSSFAGVGLEITNVPNQFDSTSDIDEVEVKEVNKYDKLRLGVEKEYMDSIKETYFLADRRYGLNIAFLIYSDVRSSQMIFEDLMQVIDENISKIVAVIT